MLDTFSHSRVKSEYTVEIETIEDLEGTDMAVTVKDLPACPVETTLTLISDKWKVMILRDLLPGTKRFGELKKSIGHVSQAAPDGGERPAHPKGLCRGPAPR